MLEIIIDWLQFTSKDPNPFNTIIHILQLDVKMFTELPKGKLGYKKQLYYDNIAVLYEGNEDMGTHVIISGKGCRAYEIEEPIINLIDRIRANGLKCTRIDIAVDDKEGNIIPLDKLVEDITTGNVVSKWNFSFQKIKRRIEDGSIVGETLEVGSRKSETFLRIYDKSLEQDLAGNWTRMELEVKGKKAEKLQELITIENIGNLTKSILNNYIRVVEPSKDSNKSRWKNRKYWDNIINTTDKTSLSSKRGSRTLEDLEKWIEKQVAPTLATIVMAKGGDVDYLYDQIDEGKKRMKARHKSIINEEMAKDDE